MPSMAGTLGVPAIDLAKKSEEGFFAVTTGT
jgi:hypothetical protein